MSRILFSLVIIAILILSLTDYRSIHDSKFNGNVNRWTTAMEKQFQEKRVPDASKTDYAIDFGLKTTPDLQQVMKDRQSNYTRVAPVWSWFDFVNDLSRVNDEAQSLSHRFNGRLFPFSNADSFLSEKVQLEVQDPLRTHDIRAIDALDIHLPDIHIPSIDFDKIFQRLKPSLESARRNLEHTLADKKSSAEDVIKVVHDFIEVQKELLPQEVQHALKEYQKFKTDHPYLVAGATVALVIIGTEIIFPYAFLGVLRLLGFGELGPLAGSWAPALQSCFYGGRTRGLFSILQSISMRGKVVWPITVFTDITAAAAGTLAVLPPGEIKALVEEWANHPFPIELDGTIVAAELDQWMGVLGEKMEEAQVPHVQWFDVAIEGLRRRLEDLAHH